MSTSVTGRVVDESGNGIAGLVVVARDESALFSGDLGNASTDANGSYTVPIAAPRTLEFGTRKLGVYVRTGVYKNPPTGPPVPVGRLVFSQTLADVSGAVLTIADVALRSADVQGWPVSLPGTTDALPVRNGNALHPLPDDQTAWQYIALSMLGPQQSVSLMQLELDVPQNYEADATQEYQEIILGFPDSFDGITPPTTATDPVTFPRPERLMLDAAANGHQVRVMIPFLGSWTNLPPGWLAMFPGPNGSFDTVSKYFGVGSPVKVLAFTTTGFAVIHAKVLLIDAVGEGTSTTEAILLGSPFSQGYWDTGMHQAYDARRGSRSGPGIPVHDVSLGVRGPLVADLQQQFLVHWNKYCSPQDTVQPLTPPAELTAAGTGEYLATAQVARTVNLATLPGLNNGEQGILEAYLRAIEKATDYIYFENQYFTNQTIGDALIAALTDASRPNLQVILMVNVVPDIKGYPTWQTNLLGRIRREAGTGGASRFGVFTSWSHTGPTSAHKQAKPVIMPNYLHTKTAIVDGKWATIGSANLDGASLDNFQAPVPGVNRNDELNVLVFNDTSAGFPPTDLVDALRIALWSEHLGIPAADPRLSAATLSASHGWLQLWSDCAAAKLQGLIGNPADIDPSKGHILAYPASAWSGSLATLPFLSNYRNFLKAAAIGGQGIDFSQITLVEKTVAFSFHDGKWADA